MKQKTLISRKTSKSLTVKPKIAKSGRQKVHSPEVLPLEDEENDLAQNQGNEDEVTEPEDPSEDEIASSMPATTVSTEPEVSAISPNDPLRRYLEEIRRYPLLESGEEFALVKKLREQGDLQAAR